MKQWVEMGLFAAQNHYVEEAKVMRNGPILTRFHSLFHSSTESCRDPIYRVRDLSMCVSGKIFDRIYNGMINQQTRWGGTQRPHHRNLHPPDPINWAPARPAVNERAPDHVPTATLARQRRSGDPRGP